MDLLLVLVLVAFLCAAVISVIDRAWPLALVALGLAGWLVASTNILH